MAIEVEIDRTAARITFRGWDKFWALSPGLYIEARRIVAATVLPRKQASQECSWLRLPGSFWPGKMHAGSFGIGDKRQLWCVHAAKDVLVIELRDRPYCRVVIEVEHADDLAGLINAIRP